MQADINDGAAIAPAVFGEALARHYADAYGISMLCRQSRDGLPRAQVGVQPGSKISEHRCLLAVAARCDYPGSLAVTSRTRRVR